LRGVREVLGFSPEIIFYYCQSLFFLVNIYNMNYYDELNTPDTEEELGLGADEVLKTDEEEESEEY